MAGKKKTPRGAKAPVRMEISVSTDGSVSVPFFPPSFSKFIIDNMYNEKERKTHYKYQDPKSSVKDMIFCG